MPPGPLSRRNLLLAVTGFAAGSVPVDTLARARVAKARDPQSSTRIDVALRAATKGTPGIVAMAATDAGVMYEGAFGVRRLGAAPTMTLNTVFRIASMVKPVTSVAAMQLVEQGKLTLDGPIPDINHALTAPQVLYGFDSSGVPQLRPAKRPITLRHLLTHTAGFSYTLWDSIALRYARTLAKLPANSNTPRKPLMFDPGDCWAYGSSTDWVGHIIETISDQPLDNYFREHILDPLGMTDTCFVASPEQLARAASAHYRLPDGSIEPQPMKSQSKLRSYANGALYSTAPDYLTFVRMLLHGGSFNGNRILRPETIALMGQNQIGTLEAGVMKTTNPALSNDVDFFPGVSLKWGLGHMINMQPGPDGRSAGSLTWAGLFNTYYWIDPTRRLAAVFMTQILPFADHAVLRIYREFERGIYDLLRAI